MASINWPSALSDVLVSNATVSEPGLAGWWSMNTVSEYPTGTAQWLRTTFTSADVATGTDGPTASKYAWADQSIWDNYNLQVVGGVIQFEKRAGGVSGGLFRINQDARNKTRRIKIKPSTTATISFDTDGTTYNRLVQGGVWNLVDVSFDGTGSPITDIQSWPIGVHQISLDYIGDGSYAANSLLDNSGNRNHYRVFGSTPIAGVSSNGLSRDGTTDYERSESVLSTIPDVWHLREVRPNGSASLAQNQTIFNYGVNSGPYLWIYRESSTDTLRVAFYNTADTSVAFANFFTGFSATRIDIDVTIDWVNRTATVYRNGTQFGQATLTSAVKPAVGGYAYWGAYQGTAHFSRSVVDERREYTSITAARIAELYSSPSSYSALPNAPLQDSYSEARQNGIIRSTVDAGAPKMRQRFTAVTRQYNVSFALTNFQSQILDYFYYTTTSQGVALFNWTDPRTGASVEARFIEPPVHRPNGPEFISSCTFEVLP